jgi:TPR repeat protein
VVGGDDSFRKRKVSGREFFFFSFCSFSLLQAREAAKSGAVLFQKAMDKTFHMGYYDVQFACFEGAAVKGHEESIWVWSVAKDVEMKKEALIEAFAKTEEPLGFWFAGKLSDGRERLDFFKKSAEGGCSWGQADYAKYFNSNIVEGYIEHNEKVYLEWLQKAANQNNPDAMGWLGHWFRYYTNDMEKAVSYYRPAAEMGRTMSKIGLSDMLRNGKGCAEDWREAAIWSSQGFRDDVFPDIMRNARQLLERGTTEDLNFDFDQLCYSIGWGLFWYWYGTWGWKTYHSDESQAFGNRCLDYYCSCVELQQKSIFTFLCCWNQITGGIKGPGQMIAQMVWSEREDNLVRKFVQSREEPEVKRIKK